MNYASIKSCDIANGPGVRVSLFVSGCTHHCKDCFNEEAWDFSYGEPFTDEVSDRLLAMLPEDLRGCFAPYLCEGCDYDHQIVKAADSLSAYLKCVEERRAGNHEFDAAGEAIRRQLDAITLPEVQDFIREFVPSFSLTLDELNQPGGNQA